MIKIQKCLQVHIQSGPCRKAHPIHIASLRSNIEGVHKNIRADVKCEGIDEVDLLEAFDERAKDASAEPEYREFMKSAAKAVKELKSDAERDKEQIAHLQEEIKVYTSYLKTASKNYDELENFLKEERRLRVDFEYKVETLETQLNAEREKPKVLTEQLLGQTKENAALKAENTRLKAENEQLNRALKNIENMRLERLHGEKLLAENNQLKIDIAKLQQEKEKSEVKCNRIAAGRRGTEEKLLQMYREMLAWQQKTRELEPEIQRLRSVLQAQLQQLKAKDLQINKMKSDYEQTKTMYNEVLRRYVPEVQKEIERLQAIVNTGTTPVSNMPMNGSNTSPGNRTSSTFNR